MPLQFTQISAMTVAVPAIIGLARWRVSDGQGRVLALLALSSGLVELGAELLDAYAWPFYFLIHIWILIEISLLSHLYGRLLQRPRLTLATWVAFVITGMAMELAVAGPSEYPFLLRNVESVVIVLYAILWFVQRMIRSATPHIWKTLGFWVATSNFVYFTGSFLLFNMVGYLQRWGAEMVDRAWNFHAVLAIMMFTGYTIALLCKETPTPASSPLSGSAAASS